MTTKTTFSTAGFRKTVSYVYNFLMNTIHLSHSTQVAERTVFRKHTACHPYYSVNLFIFLFIKTSFFFKVHTDGLREDTHKKSGFLVVGPLRV